MFIFLVVRKFAIYFATRALYLAGFFCSKPVIVFGGLFRFDIQTYHLESRNQDWKVGEGIF